MAALSEAWLPEDPPNSPKAEQSGDSTRISRGAGSPPCRNTVVATYRPPSPKLGHWSLTTSSDDRKYAKTPEFRGFVQVLR